MITLITSLLVSFSTDELHKILQSDLINQMVMSMSESQNIIQMNNDHIPESDESDEDFDLDEHRHRKDTSAVGLVREVDCENCCEPMHCHSRQIFFRGYWRERVYSCFVVGVVCDTEDEPPSCANHRHKCLAVAHSCCLQVDAVLHSAFILLDAQYPIDASTG